MAGSARLLLLFRVDRPVPVVFGPVNPAFKPEKDCPSFAIAGKNFFSFSQRLERNIIYKLPRTADFLWMQLKDFSDVELFYARVHATDQDGLKRVKFEKAEILSDGLVKLKSVDYIYIQKCDDVSQSEENASNVVNSEFLADAPTDSTSITRNADLRLARYYNVLLGPLNSLISGFATIEFRGSELRPVNDKFWAIMVCHDGFHSIRVVPELNTDYKLPSTAKVFWVYYNYRHLKIQFSYYSAIGVDADGRDIVEVKVAEPDHENIVRIREPVDYFCLFDESTNSRNVP